MVSKDILFLDLETQSEVDLRVTGADPYARHPSTKVMALGYAFGEDDPVVLPFGKHPGIKIVEHIRQGKKVVCHNANFEWVMWNYCFSKKLFPIPELKIEQMICTMTEAYAMSLPGSLENAASAVGLNNKKDMAGNRIMLKLCKPKEIKDDGTIIWYTESEYPELYKEMYKYCAQDIRVHRELFKRLMRLSPREHQLWCLDHKINQRGIKIDIANAEKAKNVVEAERIRLDKEMRRVTKNKVATCTSTAQLVRWLSEEGIEKCESVAKANVIDMLNLEDLPPHCRDALELRQEAAKSSTKKLDAMILKACDDGRVRSTMQYHGASTGRWAGRGIQVQNFPRSKLQQEEIEDFFKLLAIKKTNIPDLTKGINIFYGPPLSVISDCLRGFIVAEEKYNLITADFANIEGRILAWLAGEEWKLKAFANYDAGTGHDIYKLAAQAIYSVNHIEDVTKEQRQIGKVAELALGYQGGKGAFTMMAKGYGVKVTEKRVEEIKNVWRNAHPRTVAYWSNLNMAALLAVKRKGMPSRTGPTGRQVTYKVSGSFLWCLLPSGRALCYPYPKIWKQIWVKIKIGKAIISKTFHGQIVQDAQDAANAWTEEYDGEIIEVSEASDCVSFMAVGATTNKWQRQIGYGGYFAENNTQAVARDVLAEALFRLEEHSYPVIMHVHDEAVSENNYGSIEEMKKIMAKAPSWAIDLPIAVEGWQGLRYRK